MIKELFFLPPVSRGRQKKYADVAEKITGKPITLWGLRPSAEIDEQGFIKTILLRMHFVIPLPHMAKWLPRITPRGQEALKSLLKNDEKEIQYTLKLESFRNELGDEILSLYELTSKSYGDIHSETEKSHACFCLPNHFVVINGVLSEIYGLEYEMPYDHDIREIRISDNSKNRFVVLDKDGKELKIVTDNMLSGYEFDEVGNLKKR